LRDIFSVIYPPFCKKWILEKHLTGCGKDGMELFYLTGEKFCAAAGMLMIKIARISRLV